MDPHSPELCLVCFKYHPLRFCKRFKRLDLKSRQYLVRVHRYCVNCFARTHLVGGCTSMGSCQICGDLHHSLLHPESARSTAGSINSKSSTRSVQSRLSVNRSSGTAPVPNQRRRGLALGQQQRRQPQEQRRLQQGHRSPPLVSALGQLTGAFNVAPVQRGRHVEDRSEAASTIEDDLIDLD